MAPKRNNMIPNVHFHKDWQRYIKTWFNQPARKVRRHQKRLSKAHRVAPRPVGKLRPVIRCPTARYNTRERLGKGFSLPELKAAGICKREAMTIGISVDYKRKNRSVEAMQKNVLRLQEYRSKLILFPKNKKKLKKSDSSLEECSKAVQLKDKNVMPLPKKTKTPVHIKTMTIRERKFCCYDALKRERKNAKTWGIKAKRAREAAEDAAVIAKK